MKDNIIEFLYPKKAKEFLEEIFPVRAVQNIPDWFKNIKEHNHKKRTIKGCVPFLDAFTAGYILKMPSDFYINHNYTNKDKKDTAWSFPIKHGDILKELKLNINNNDAVWHDIEQLGGTKGGCPFVEKNKKLPFYKIQYPFRIKTPPGYSCLFIPPLNNKDDRFEIFSGIVDTDTYYNYVNFPILLNGDKYPVLETIIERGTPFAQIIPFKRESWKMSIKEDNLTRAQAELSVMGRFIHSYKKLFWNKKSWK